jgi:hypothetical protein
LLIRHTILANAFFLLTSLRVNEGLLPLNCMTLTGLNEEVRRRTTNTTQQKKWVLRPEGNTAFSFPIKNQNCSVLGAPGRS